MNESYVEIPLDTQPRKCTSCNEKVFWVKTKQGKFIPVDYDGTPHWLTCAKKGSHRKK